MRVDSLIKGNPYIYNGVGGSSKESKKVIFDSVVSLLSGAIVYHFRFRREDRAGFVNLTKEQVENQIREC